MRDQVGAAIAVFSTGTEKSARILDKYAKVFLEAICHHEGVEFSDPGEDHLWVRYNGACPRYELQVSEDLLRRAQKLGATKGNLCIWIRTQARGRGITL